MASTYSDLGLELMVTGENAGTWGDKTNTNLNLINQVAAGYESIALSDGGTVTLALTDGAVSNARNMILKFTGTLTSASTVTIPDALEKFYIIDLSAVVGVTNLTIKTVSGTGFTAGEAAIVAAYSDGTNLNEIALNTLGGTIATSQLTGTISTAQIADNSIVTAKISDNQIVTAKISDNQITTAKIADDAVTADKLADTAVTPGSYTSTAITVDQQGRITAASTGSGGAGAFVWTTYQVGGTGTFTLNPATNYVGAYLGGGGGGGGGGTRGAGGGNGGSGGYGWVSGPASGTLAYDGGSGGNGGGGSFGVAAPGNAGAGASLGSPALGTAGGGNGGQGAYFNPGQNIGGTPGNAGSLSAGSGTVFQMNTVPVISIQNGGGSGNPGGGIQSTGAAGGAGYIVLLENIGV